MIQDQTLARVPPHLRRFVVLQNYGAYNEIDQTVWRFALIHTCHHLEKTAHPAYRQGLQRTGIPLQRIPRISDMDQCLSHYGWGAVCVDGFIPPRAFQEFLRLRILPIAADIRSRDQLPYTPAPDIIHESAGHAPILIDANYSAFLQKSGEIGSKAFSLPYDRRLYDAIFALSEIKGDARASPTAIAKAEAMLESCLAEEHDTSEAARLARFYWWTVEYGLIGTLDDYKIYGAGLLSSLGESHVSHIATVEKQKLTVNCLDVDYDITTKQPQLFVTQSFEELNSVLDQAAETLAHRKGGRPALDAAIESQEVATFHLDNRCQAIGILRNILFSDDVSLLLELEGPAALAESEGIFANHKDTPVLNHGLAIPVGPLADGSLPSTLDERTLRSHYVDQQGVLTFNFRSGVQVKGKLLSVRCTPQYTVSVVWLQQCELRHNGELKLSNPEGLPYPLVLTSKVITAHAGSCDDSFWPPAEFPEKQVPLSTVLTKKERSLLREYEALSSQTKRLSDSDANAIQHLESIHQRINAHYPDEWLLRWMLLEQTLTQTTSTRLRDTLVTELSALEHYYEQKQPIATALRRFGY